MEKLQRAIRKETTTKEIKPKVKIDLFSHIVELSEEYDTHRYNQTS